MSREAHVRFWERAGVRLPRATRYNARDPVVIARYMSTTSPAVWLVIDFDPETGEAVAYKAGIGNDGWDLFNLLELSQLRIPTTTTY